MNLKAPHTAPLLDNVIHDSEYIMVGNLAIYRTWYLVGAWHLEPLTCARAIFIGDYPLEIVEKRVLNDALRVTLHLRVTCRCTRNRNHPLTTMLNVLKTLRY